MINILIVAFSDLAISFCRSASRVTHCAFALLLWSSVVLLVFFLVRPSLVYVWHADQLAVYGEQCVTCYEQVGVHGEQCGSLLVESIVRRCYVLEYLGLGKLSVVYHK